MSYRQCRARRKRVYCHCKAVEWPNKTLYVFFLLNIPLLVNAEHINHSNHCKWQAKLWLTSNPGVLSLMNSPSTISLYSAQLPVRTSTKIHSPGSSTRACSSNAQFLIITVYLLSLLQASLLWLPLLLNAIWIMVSIFFFLTVIF